MHRLIHQLKQHMTIQNGTMVLALLIALGWMWGTVQTLQKNFDYQRQVDALAQEVELEKLRNQNLQYEQRYYGSDEFLELSARQRLGKANPGEKLIILPDSRGIKDTTGTQTAAVVAPPASNLSQWTEFFFGEKAE